MIRSGIIATAPRQNERTKQMEMVDMDIIDLTDQEFAEYFISADEKERFVIVNTLRRCCIGLSDFGDNEAP